MKKMLKGLAGFAIVLALVVGVVGTVFANESKSGDVTVSTDDNYVEIDQDASQQKGVDGGWTELTTAQAASMIGGGVTADQLQIVWQMVITADTPATISFTYDGYKDGQTLYVFHNGWKELGGGGDAWDGPVANAQAKTVTATFDDLSPVALVVYTPSGSSSDETSPKTGETNALLFIALAAIALGSVTAVVVSKKKA